MCLVLAVYRDERKKTPKTVLSRKRDRPDFVRGETVSSRMSDRDGNIQALSKPAFVVKRKGADEKAIDMFHTCPSRSAVLDLKAYGEPFHLL